MASRLIDTPDQSYAKFRGVLATHCESAPVSAGGFPYCCRNCAMKALALLNPLSKAARVTELVAKRSRPRASLMSRMNSLGVRPVACRTARESCDGLTLSS